MSVPSYCGIGGLGLPTVNTAFTNFLPAMRNWKMRPNWEQYETARGTFSATYLDNYADILANNGLYYYIIMLLAPALPSNWANSDSPQYLFSAPDSVPLVLTDTGNYYPYYFDSNYGTRRSNMQSTFLAQIFAYTGIKATFLLGVESAEGKTGDEQPYAGNPTNSLYNISTDDWNVYKQGIWTPEYAVVIGASKYFLINSGNDGGNYQWVLDNTPNAWMKSGELTHYYNNYGEIYDYQRFVAFRTSGINDNRVGGENEGVVALPWWITSPTQNTQYILASCAHCAVDMFHVSTANALTDHTAYDWFNERAGVRSTSETTLGWCVFRDILDVADLIRFPEATYGSLVAAADQPAYNVKYNTIITSGDPYYLIQDRLTRLLSNGKSGGTYVNSTRIANILAANPGANYISFSASLESYNQDLGINMIPDNYYHYLTEFNPNDNSKGVWRVGNVLDFWGRFGRSFDTANGKNERFFSVDSGLTGNNSYNVRIKVYYLDSGTHQWSLNYWNGGAKVSAGTIINTNTNRVIIHTFTINDFFGGSNLSNASDITLKNESASDSTHFAMDIFVDSENPPITGGVASSVLLGNTLSTICSAGLADTIYTDGVFDLTKIIYANSSPSVPVIGYSYLVKVSSGIIYNINPATGEILSATSGICGGGTPIDVILGNAIPDVCNNTPTTVYITTYAIGTILYEDINLTTNVTTFTYAVAPNGRIYNIDSSTGEVLSDTGNICANGIAANYILGNDSVTICDTNTVTVLYTGSAFGIGSQLFTDINLTDPLTTYQYIARLSDNFIYQINDTNGIVLSNTNIKCNMALKTLTISRLRLQPKPDYNIKVSIYWHYHLDPTETLVVSDIVVDPDGYFSPLITISNLDSTRQYVVVTAVNELCETVAQQMFLLETNISCPIGFTLSEDGTYCYMIETIEATPPTSPEVAVAATATAYSTCGTYVYQPGYNVNGTGTANLITDTNPFWINWNSGASPIPALCSDNNTVDGPLNRCGLWATTTVSDQDIGFSICLNIPASKTYLIGIGVDNYGSIKIDGDTILQQDPAALATQYGSSSITFKGWLVYPVTLSAGLHIIEIIGHNTTSIAAFGAEIYDNTEAELIAATGYPDLNLIFSTKDYVGAPIQIGTDGIGYTCPTGYSVNVCNSPVTCTRIIKVPPIVG